MESVRAQMEILRKAVSELDCRIEHGAAKWQLTFAVGKILQLLARMLIDIGS